EYVASGGVRGIPKQEEVSFEGEGEERRPKRITMPQEVLDVARARDEYNEAIDPDEDPEQNGLLYSFQAADQFFVYGQFDEARRRFEEMYAANCGANEWGYRAWEKLISM